MAPGFSFDLTTGISWFWFFRFLCRSGFAAAVGVMSSGRLSRNWTSLVVSDIGNLSVTPRVTKSNSDVSVWLTRFRDGSSFNGGSFHHSGIHNFHKWPYYQIRVINYVIGEFQPIHRRDKGLQDSGFEWNH